MQRIEGLEALVGLHELNLSGNQISALGHSLNSNMELETLYLSGNPLSSLQVRTRSHASPSPVEPPPLPSGCTSAALPLAGARAPDAPAEAADARAARPAVRVGAGHAPVQLPRVRSLPPAATHAPRLVQRGLQAAQGLRRGTREELLERAFTSISSKLLRTSTGHPHSSH